MNTLAQELFADLRERHPRSLRIVESLIKQGQVDDALRLLQDALRRGLLDAEGIDKAGRLIARNRPGLRTARPGWPVRLLGQCTTSWLATSLTAIAWADDVSLEVSESAYD